MYNKQETIRILWFIGMINHLGCWKDTQGIRKFLAYVLLEDRRKIDVINSKFYLPCFKMAERF